MSDAAALDNIAAPVLELVDREAASAAAGPDAPEPESGFTLSADEVSDLHSSREFIQLLRSRGIGVGKIKDAVQYESDLESLQMGSDALRIAAEGSISQAAILYHHGNGIRSTRPLRFEQLCEPYFGGQWALSYIPIDQQPSSFLWRQ